MDLNARVDVNCGRKDGQTENWTPISHLAKAGATKIDPLRKESNYKNGRGVSTECVTLPLELLTSSILKNTYSFIVDCPLTKWYIIEVSIYVIMAQHTTRITPFKISQIWAGSRNFRDLQKKVEQMSRG